jgi:hypothetical protein
MRMLAATFAACATLVMGLALTQPASAAPSARPACAGKNVTIKGQAAIVYCGPATATLTVGGKTYRFKDGYCESDARSKTLLILNMGTVIYTSPSNGGKPTLGLVVLATRGSATAVYGGKKVLAFGDLAKAKGPVPQSGTFAGTSGKFSGSWNCHGKLYKIS